MPDVALHRLKATLDSHRPGGGSLATGVIPQRVLQLGVDALEPARGAEHGDLVMPFHLQDNGDFGAARFKVRHVHDGVALAVRFALDRAQTRDTQGLGHLAERSIVDAANLHFIALLNLGEG